MKTIYLFAFLFITSNGIAQQPLLLPILAGEKWGYCDTNGMVIIPAEFDQAEYFTNKVQNQKQVNFWYALVRKGNYVNWLNAEGRTLFSFDSIRAIECHSLNENLWALSLSFSSPTHGFERVALINKNMDFIRPFEVARYISNSFVFDFGENFLMEKYVEGKHGCNGIINAKGEVLIEPQYVNISNLWQNKYIALPFKSNKWLFYEMPGKVIDTLHYYPLTGIYDGLMGVYEYRPGIAGQSCGFVNANSCPAWSSLPLNLPRATRPLTAALGSFSDPAPFP